MYIAVKGFNHLGVEVAKGQKLDQVHFPRDDMDGLISKGLLVAAPEAYSEEQADVPKKRTYARSKRK